MRPAPRQAETPRPCPAGCPAMLGVLPRLGGGPHRGQPSPQPALGAGQQPPVGLSTALTAGRMARPQGVSRWDTGVRGPQSHHHSPRLLSQTHRLEGREALPRSRVTQGERVPTPALPPLPRLEATQAAAPRYALAAPTPGSANVTKLPALPAAATSGSSLRGRAHAVGPTASGHRELVPPARGILGERGMAVRAERRGPAPHGRTTCDVALESTVQSLVSGVLRRVVAASRGPGQQLAAQGHLARTTGLATPTRTAQVQAAKGGEAPAAQPGPPHPDAPGATRAAGEARAPVSPGSCAGKGHWARPVARPGHRLPPLRLGHGKLLRTRPVDAPKRLVVVRIKMEHLEELEQEDDDKRSEDLSGQSQLEDDISIHTIWSSLQLLSLSQEPHTGPQKVPGSPGSMARDTAGQADDHPQRASPAPSADSDVEPAAFCLAGGPGDQGHSEPLLASAPEDVQLLAPPLPAAMLQAADDSADALGTAQGILGDQDLAAGAEGQGPGPVGPITSDTALEDLEEEWEEVPDRDTAGEAASDLKSASLAPLTREDAEPAEPCLAGAPREQGRSEPLPASVPEDTSFSTSPSPGAARQEGHSVTVPASAPPLPAVMPQLADDGAKTVGAAQGMLSDQGLAARMESQGPAPVGPVTCDADPVDLEEEWEEVPDRDAAGEGDGDTQSASLAPSEDAGAEAAASPLARGPAHEGHRAPTPAQPLAYSSPSHTGTAALPRAPAHRRWLSVLRTACRALRRAFRCTCLTGQ